MYLPHCTARSVSGLSWTLVISDEQPGDGELAAWFWLCSMTEQLNKNLEPLAGKPIIKKVIQLYISDDVEDNM